MNEYVRASTYKACMYVCMWTREHVYVIAHVGAKNDSVSVCLCIHPSTRFSIGMYLNIYVRNVQSSVFFSVHLFICIHECLFQRVNVSACPPVGQPVYVFK